MKLIDKIFKRSVGNDGENREEKYPLVHYINQNTARIENSILRFPPHGDSFYIGDYVSYHIIHWDRTDHNGKRNAVKLIRNRCGNEIYRNMMKFHL